MSQSERISTDNLRFRPIQAADEALLYSIYASTRAEEMALVPFWSEDQKTAFLTQQFQAQHHAYQAGYRNREYSVILVDDQPAGRLYLDHRDLEIRIVDITLLPAFQRKGLGEYILRGILDNAANAGKKVTIHVERMNPALHLYERLGFRMVDDSNQVYLLMEWRA